VKDSNIMHDREEIRVTVLAGSGWNSPRCIGIYGPAQLVSGPRNKLELIWDHLTIGEFKMEVTEHLDFTQRLHDVQLLHLDSCS